MFHFERHKRSIAKSITYRIVIIISDFTIVYLFTHRVDATVGVIIATNLGSAVLYYFHERVWNAFSWGRLTR